MKLLIYSFVNFHPAYLVSIKVHRRDFTHGSSIKYEI